MIRYDFDGERGNNDNERERGEANNAQERDRG